MTLHCGLCAHLREFLFQFGQTGGVFLFCALPGRVVSSLTSRQLAKPMVRLLPKHVRTWAEESPYS